MGQTTKIQWCDHTFNPWRGCAKIAAGCLNCYAEAQAARNPAVLGEWGPKGKRALAAEAYWKLPARWNAAAREAGERRRVFCGSLMDVFEARRELQRPRWKLFWTILDTPHLDWLLLTKRPGNWRQFWPLEAVPGHVSQNEGDGKRWRPIPNLWMGFSASTQADLDAGLPALLEIPAAVRFLSLEPLLEPIDLEFAVHWVIAGGESGPKARPCDLGWIRSIVAQCRAAGVPVFVKQLGALPILTGLCDDAAMRLHGHLYVGPRPDLGGFRVHFDHLKGGDPSEWPEDLRVREFPLCPSASSAFSAV